MISKTSTSSLSAQRQTPTEKTSPSSTQPPVKTLSRKEGTEFDPSAGGTIEVGSIAGGSHTVQVLETDIRVYDAGKYRGPLIEFCADDVKILAAQIWPIVDEEAGTYAKAAGASFADPFVLVVKDDSSLLLMKADRKRENLTRWIPSRISE